MSQVDELAKETGKSRAVVYRLAKKLGRLPTKKEVLCRKNGRPVKYKKITKSD